MLRSSACLPSDPALECAREQRHATIARVLWWVLVANLAVAVAKFVYGSWVELQSMRADGLHSFTDGASNLIGLLALRLAQAPPDREHPYGHRKIEVAGSLAIGVMILFGMVEVARSIFQAALGHRPPDFGVEGYYVAFGTLAINLTVAAVESILGKRLNSMILMADARHTLSDSLATICVILGMLALHAGYARADVVAATVVMILIVSAAWTIFRSGLGAILDQAQLSAERIRAVAVEVPGVFACHAVRSRGQPDHIFVDLHVLVDPELTVRAGHLLAHQVSQAILHQIPEVAEVLVHVEPWDDVDRPDYE